MQKGEREEEKKTTNHEVVIPKRVGRNRTKQQIIQ